MVSAGIDIGSRTIALLVLDSYETAWFALEDTGFNPLQKAREMIAPLPPGAIITATGYGRHAAKAHFAHRVITEIKAHTLGAGHFFPEARAVLDIGGQDMKAIVLDGHGNVENFQMNDKCAAGTGRFLEVMACSLGYASVEDFGRESTLGRPGEKINSMCTVFAESEAVSMLHRGINRRDIGRALHAAVIERAFGLLQRTGFETPLLFSGGVAMNPCIVDGLKDKINGLVVVPEMPQLVGAYGAALAGCKQE